MKRVVVFLFLLVFSFAYAEEKKVKVDEPKKVEEESAFKVGELIFKELPEQKILYIVHKGKNDHTAAALSTLLAYYMNPETKFKVNFPQMAIQKKDETLMALSYVGDDLKLGVIPAGTVASKAYKGAYDQIDLEIKKTIDEILATKKYEIQKDKDGNNEVRLLYWDSPDNTEAKDLITEIQISVIKK